MAFTLANYPSATSRALEVPELQKKPPPPIVDQSQRSSLALKAHDKHDVAQYVYLNAPMIGIAGFVTGLQEAFYKFEKLPPSVSRNNLLHFRIVFAPIFQKSAVATGLGALFCASDALLEKYRGKHDIYSGIYAGAITGAAFGILRPYPQPFTWPLAFGFAAAAADVLCEHMPKFFGSNSWKYWGAIPGRENWGDPEPPRPPIMDTGAGIRPTDGGHFWRGE